MAGGSRDLGLPWRRFQLAPLLRPRQDGIMKTRRRSVCLTLAWLSLSACADERLLVLEPELAVAPNPLVITVPRGGTGSGTVVMKNAGAGFLRVDSVELTSPDGRLTLAEPASPRMLGAGETRDVRIAVDATDGEPSAATLQVESAAGSASVPVTVVLIDAPVGCVLVADPPTLSLGTVERGGTRVAPVTLRNDGDADCVIVDVGLEADSDDAFSVTALASLTLAPGGAAAVVVTLTVPVDATTGLLRGAVIVNEASGADLTINLDASLDTPSLCVTPGVLDLGAIAAPMTQLVTLTSCGAQPLTVTGAVVDSPLAGLSLALPVALPVTLAVGETIDVTVAVDVALAPAGDRTLRVTSNDPAGDDTVRVRWTRGGGGDELCDNGLDDDGDLLIDEGCVAGPALGRAVALGAGRLMLWGDEHVTFDSYGTAPRAFWRNTIQWLGGDSAGPPVVLDGTFSSGGELPIAVSELGGTVGSFSIDDVGAGHVFIVRGGSTIPGLRGFIERGGGVLVLAIGLGEGECEFSLDPTTTGLPLQFSCEEPAPWGPVAALRPHPVTLDLELDAVPFVNGRYVMETPGTGSTVIAQP
jgi:hypothetical protein